MIAACGRRRPRVRPSGIHGCGAGPSCTGISGSGDRPAAVADTAPVGGEAGVEPASRGPQPRVLTAGRSPSRLRRGELNPVLRVMSAGCSPVHHAAAMDDGRSRGSAGRWGDSNSQRRVYRTRARPLLASAADPSADGSMEKSRRAPAASHRSRTPPTVVPISSGCCGQRWTHPTLPRIEGLINVSPRFPIGGRRRAESNRGLRINGPGQDPSCYACVWTRPESDRDRGIFAAPLAR